MHMTAPAALLWVSRFQRISAIASITVCVVGIAPVTITTLVSLSL